MSDYASEFSIRRLWIIFGASMAIMFGALLYFGVQIYHTKPPMPGAVRTASGQILYTGEDIQRGQAVWQSTGGMQQGSIWGHGSYVAPDWSADWLHREAIALRDGIAGTSTDAVRRAGRTRSGADRRDPQARDAHQRLRSADHRHHRQRPAGGRHRGDGGAFRGPVHQPHARRPASARALRDAAERGADGATKRMR